MITIIQNHDFYDVKFPYDLECINLIKTVPGKKWCPDDKCWTIPKDKLGWFLHVLKDTRYENDYKIISDESINENQTLDSTQFIPDIQDHFDYLVKDGSQPYSHQIDFMKYAIDRQNHGMNSGFIVADQPGLGKTSESMNLALYNKQKKGFKHCLIICCVNSSKYNWENDITQHTNGEHHPYILGSRKKKNGRIVSDTGTAEKLKDLESGKMYGEDDGCDLPYFIIMNVEGLRAKSGKKYPIADQLIEWIYRGDIPMVIIDEVHKNLSHTSTQGKQLLRIKKATSSKAMWIPMTGTPIINKPTDVFLSLKLVDGHQYNSFYSFSNQYCIFGGYGDYEIVGYKNIKFLKTLLQKNMIRRLKSEVLDLPPKIYFNEYIENTSYQNNLYDHVANDIRNSVSEIKTPANLLAKLIRLRQVNGYPEAVDTTLNVSDKDYLKKNAKMCRTLELIDEILERDEKVLVFSNWVEPLRTLYKFLRAKNYKVCCFTGTMNDSDREKNKQLFQTDADHKILIGTIGAMGTTHTFTAAQNAIFIDEPWTPADKLQAEDRIYRIGTKSSVNIYTILTKGTVDEKVHKLLYNKEVTSNYIVDNKLDIKANPDILEMLL